jgi:hypothetical protein
VPKPSELKLLREQVKAQRALLRRAQRWIGVAAGALAAAQDKEHFSYPMRDSVTDALKCAGDISAALADKD